MKGGPLLSLLGMCPHCPHEKHVPGCCKAMRFVIAFREPERGGAFRCECQVETDGAGECGVEGHAPATRLGTERTKGMCAAVPWAARTEDAHDIPAARDRVGEPILGAGIKPGHSPAAFVSATIEEAIRGAQERARLRPVGGEGERDTASVASADCNNPGHEGEAAQVREHGDAVSTFAARPAYIPLGTSAGVGQATPRSPSAPADVDAARLTQPAQPSRSGAPLAAPAPAHLGRLEWSKVYRVRCPECERLCVATAEWYSMEPWPRFVHVCEHCAYVILEAEWNEVPPSNLDSTEQARREGRAVE